MRAEIWRAETGAFLVFVEVDVVEASALVSSGACVVETKNVDTEAEAVEWFVEWVNEQQSDAVGVLVPKKDLEVKALRELTEAFCRKGEESS